MSLSIVVITQYDNIKNIYTLFENLKLQTVLPDKIYVYIISCPEKTKISIYDKDYPFLINIYTNQKLNVSDIDTKYISFMNAGDVPHIQRNEILKKIFCADHGCKAILHNYDNIFNIENMFRKQMKKIDFYKNGVKKIKSRKKDVFCFSKTKNESSDFIGNHLTIKKELLNDIVIHDNEYVCICILLSKNIYPHYIQQKLTAYINNISSLLD